MSDTLSPTRATEAPVARDGRPVHAAPYLAFLIGSSEYALPLNAVAEIQRTLVLTPVPRAPRGVVGVAALRGTITTIFDMSEHLSGERLVEPTRIVMVRLPDEIVGLLVDRVTRVIHLSSNDIESPASWNSDVSAHIVGLSRPDPDNHTAVVSVIDPTALWEGIA